jgi:cytochrome o ubiquinol oxidase subunit 2
MAPHDASAQTARIPIHSQFALDDDDVDPPETQAAAAKADDDLERNDRSKPIENPRFRPASTPDGPLHPDPRVAKPFRLETAGRICERFVVTNETAVGRTIGPATDDRQVLCPPRTDRINAAGHRAPRSAARPLARYTLPALPLLALSGCRTDGTSFLNPHGPVAALQRDLLFEVTGWMMIVVLPALLLVPLVAWRYRRRSKTSTYRPDWHFSWPIEIAVWGIPVVLVCILSVLIAGKARSLDPYAPLASDEAPLEVQVIGMEDQWLFIYPAEGIASIGVMALPTHRPVRFRLTSDGVMQSFAIPALGSQIYAMAGMETELNLLADRPGTLLGQNTQFNGFGFQAQKFEAMATSPGAFAAWVAAAKTAARPLDEGSYALVSRSQGLERLDPNRDAGPAPGLVFSSVEPGLFQATLARYHAKPLHSHGPGAAQENPHADE